MDHLSLALSAPHSSSRHHHYHHHRCCCCCFCRSLPSSVTSLSTAVSPPALSRHQLHRPLRQSRSQVMIPCGSSNPSNRCLSSSSSSSAFVENPIPEKQDMYSVGEFMTKIDDLLVVKTSSTVDEALELLVHNRVTGLPVVDDDGKLVGVVSDFDLLALDSISGTRSSDSSSLFPEPGSTWKAFKELQKLISKTHGRTVGEVMTPSPLVVREMTNLEDAARLLLETKYRRLPVVDDNGKLLGLLTRGNVIRAALKIKREAEGK